MQTPLPASSPPPASAGGARSDNEPAAFAHRKTLALLLIAVGLLLGGWLWRYGPVGGADLVRNLGEGLPLALWQLGSTLGDARVLLVLALPFCRRHPRLLWALVLSAVFGWLLSRGLKHLVHLPRPEALPAQGLSNYDQKFSGSFSFPSGHTTTIFSFIGIWLAALPFKRSAVLLLPGLLVAWSRVMLGLHWPVDVLGGAMAGIAAAWGGILVAERWPWGERPAPQRGLAITALLASLTLPFVDTGYPVTFPLRVALALAAAAMIAAIYTIPQLNARREKN